MSLVKFTELPKGSIQGGDVLAVAGAASYKVSTVELANWINKRLQGNTDKTVEQAYRFAEMTNSYVTNTVNPQLGQIGTNKIDVATLKSGLAVTDRLANGNAVKLNAVLTEQYDNQPALIASLITNDNFIKNPAAQHIGFYWGQETKIAATPAMLADLQAKNLEYPGWSRASGGLLTYNFTVALNGVLTLGQIGGTAPQDLEYRVNGGAWVKVGGDGVKSIGVGYAGLTSAGAQVSVRMKETSGGIAFAIPSPAYWLTNAGVRDAGVMVTLEKLTFGLRRKRIDLEACGYWFTSLINKWNDSYPVTKPVQFGDILESAIWEFDTNITPTPTPTPVPWDNDVRKRVVLAKDGSKDYKYLFASTDPDLYDLAEVYL